MENLKIVATIVADTVAKNTVYDALVRLVEASRKEEGCISYDLFYDIEIPNKFVVLEHWLSQAAIDIHNETAHYKSFGLETEGMIESVDISIIKQLY